MQYRLITTKQGQIPIEQIKEGTEVYSMGEWKISPKPVKGICLKCSFDTLPTTIFEKTFANYKKEFFVLKRKYNALKVKYHMEQKKASQYIESGDIGFSILPALQRHRRRPSSPCS